MESTLLDKELLALSDAPLGADSMEELHNKERILKAAAALFADKGYAGTSVREIVEAASVTKPTLYYYFKNKEDLYLKLMDMAMETFSAILDEVLARKGSMRERLTTLYAEIFRVFNENIHLLRLANSMIYGPRGATPAYDLMQASKRIEAVFSAILDAGVEENELREESREEVMLLLIGILRSIQVLLVLNLPFRSVTPQSIARAIDVVFDGARGGPMICKETRGGPRQ